MVVLHEEDGLCGEPCRPQTLQRDKKISLQRGPCVKKEGVKGPQKNGRGQKLANKPRKKVAKCEENERALYTKKVARF